MNPIDIANLVDQTVDDRYRITKRIHRGGMGTVYLAEDQRLERQVVLKVPHVSLLGEKGFAERFDREIKSVMRLDHPHIVKVHDAGMIDIVPFAVFQYLTGGSLQGRLAKAPGGRQSEADVLAWLPPIAEALDFCHAKHVLHRDVKPSNILFDEAGHPVLADFGVVKSTERTEGDLELTMKGQTPGSPEYMAPEGAGIDDLGPAYDQYALGVTVYAALSARFPVEFENPLEALVGKRPDPRPLPEVAPHLAPAAAAAVMGTLAAEPEDRFESCGAFVAAFRAGVASGAGTPPAEPPTTGPMPTSSESVTLAFGAARPAAPEKKAPAEPVKAVETRPMSAQRKATSKTLLAAVGAMLLLLVVVIVLKFSGPGAAADTEKPVISLAKPKLAPGRDFALVRTPSVTVSGRVNELGTVSVNGKRVAQLVDGGFSKVLQLEEEGLTEIVVVATDAAGNREELVCKVLFDQTPPVLTVTAPAPGAALATRETGLLVQGRVDDPAARVWIGGRSVTVRADGAFEDLAPLEGEGELAVEVEAKDVSGNAAAPAVIRILRDATPPGITIAVPPPGGPPPVVTTGEVEIRGTVDDPAATVVAGGVTVELDAGGAFVARCELSEAGEQTVAVVATDAVGNAGRAEIPVVQKNVLRVLDPVDDTATGQARVPVRGRVFGSGVRITVQGEDVVAGPDRRFETTVELTGEGDREITIVAHHPVLGEETTRLRLVRDVTPPQLDLAVPDPSIPEHRTGPATAFRVRGRVTDRALREVTVNGRRAHVAGDPRRGAQWSAEVRFPLGTQELIIEAEDAAGNAAVPIVRRLRMIDPTVPGVSIRKQGSVAFRNREGFLEYTLDRDKNVVLVLVPEATFRLGAVPGDAERGADEGPVRKVRVGPFLISKTPITRAQWARSKQDPKLVENPTHPATGVSWAEALAYCRWAAPDARLPREAEWEMAARGRRSGFPYPWGAEWGDGFANVDMKYGSTTAVDRFKFENGYGLRDVVGNVWEWCDDWYAPRYDPEAPDVNPGGPAGGEEKVLRGGSWRADPARARLSARHRSPPEARSDTFGFRIVVPVPVDG